MKRIPSDESVFRLLDELNELTAEELESDVLELKRWEDAKKSLAQAVELAVCFANADGGMAVFGVRDQVRSRAKAVMGCDRYDLDVFRRGIYDGTRPHLTVDVSELEVPEGKLLLVRVPKGPDPPYGTAGGLYLVRIGKNCMPYSPDAFVRKQVATGAVDWSAQPMEGADEADFDPLEIARLRNIVKSLRPASSLHELPDRDLLVSIGAIREGEITRAGFLLLGRAERLSKLLPDHEVIYLHHISPTDLDQRLDLKAPLLYILERLTETINSRNRFHTLKKGFFHINIPSFPEESYREAILNALIHRNYLETGSVYIRHSEREMGISSPGGFIGGITPENVLHAEPRARNRLLAEMFQKIGLVERAGIGRRRIFIPTLTYGKRAPHYEADEHMVRLTIYDGSFDETLAAFIVNRQQAGEDFDLVELLLLSYLREHTEIDISTAAKLCQLPESTIRDRLERIFLKRHPWIERRGKKSGVTYHLSRSVAAEFLGKSVYSRSRAIDRVQWPALIRDYVKEHGSINNSECRDLLMLGNSNSARTTVSRLLAELDFLEPYGTSPKTTRYRLRRSNQ